MNEDKGAIKAPLFFPSPGREFKSKLLKSARARRVLRTAGLGIVMVLSFSFMRITGRSFGRVFFGPMVPLENITY
jgi:hypothetical protein